MQFCTMINSSCTLAVAPASLLGCRLNKDPQVVLAGQSQWAPPFAIFHPRRRILAIDLRGLELIH